MATPQAERERLLDIICVELSDGKDLRSTCRQIGIDRATVNRWMLADEGIAARINRAREFGQDASIDDCLGIADTAGSEDWQVARLRIQTRQWAASRVAPRKWGERLQVDSTHNVLFSVPPALADRFADHLGLSDGKTIEGSGPDEGGI